MYVHYQFDEIIRLLLIIFAILNLGNFQRR